MHEREHTDTVVRPFINKDYPTPEISNNARSRDTECFPIEISLGTLVHMATQVLRSNCYR